MSRRSMDSPVRAILHLYSSHFTDAFFFYSLDNSFENGLDAWCAAVMNLNFVGFFCWLAMVACFGVVAFLTFLAGPISISESLEGYLKDRGVPYWLLQEILYNANKTCRSRGTAYGRFIWGDIIPEDRLLLDAFEVRKIATHLVKLAKGLSTLDQDRIMLELTRHFYIRHVHTGEDISLSNSVYFVGCGSVCMYTSENSILAYDIKEEGEVSLTNATTAIHRFDADLAFQSPSSVQIFGGASLYSVVDPSVVKANIHGLIIGISAKELLKICDDFPVFGKCMVNLAIAEKEDIW